MTRVYPRTGGETRVLVVLDERAGGLSPHGRGNPLRAFFRPVVEGSIPARAGKPLAYCRLLPC